MEKSEGSDTATGLGCVVLLAILVCAAYGGYNWLDNAGWITHDHDTPVWIQGDWLVGEYRECGMLTTTAPDGIVLSRASLAELPRLFCGKNWESEGIGEFEMAMPDTISAGNALWGRGGWSAFDSYFHVLPVHYNGRINRPDTVFDSWRCQRKSESVTCFAVD